MISKRKEERTKSRITQKHGSFIIVMFVAQCFTRFILLLLFFEFLPVSFHFCLLLLFFNALQKCKRSVDDDSRQIAGVRIHSFGGNGGLHSRLCVPAMMRVCVCVYFSHCTQTVFHLNIVCKIYFVLLALVHSVGLSLS